MDLKLLKMRCKDSKQHHVMFHELNSVSLLLCIAQNVRFEIPYKVLYFETPFLIIFKYYAWVSCGLTHEFKWPGHCVVISLFILCTVSVINRHIHGSKIEKWFYICPSYASLEL